MTERARVAFLVEDARTVLLPASLGEEMSPRAREPA